VVWDNDAFAFLDDDPPPTANPSLWRQSQLCARQGLYEVADGIYQVWGLDLSNMTLVEGDRGVIVIDPLVSKETAAAALGLYRRHRGERPVTGSSTPTPISTTSAVSKASSPTRCPSWSRRGSWSMRCGERVRRHRNAASGRLPHRRVA
jgi:Metallo-beta-lactamase superfamily